MNVLLVLDEQYSAFGIYPAKAFYMDLPEIEI
jgi:hypothetical protein